MSKTKGKTKPKPRKDKKQLKADKALRAEAAALFAEVLKLGPDVLPGLIAFLADYRQCAEFVAASAVALPAGATLDEVDLILGDLDLQKAIAGGTYKIEPNREVVEAAWDALTDEQRRILTRLYGLDGNPRVTLAAAGTSLTKKSGQVGVSASTVRARRDAAFAVMRNMLWP